MEELVIRFVGVNLMSNVLHGIGNDMDSMASKGEGAFGKLHGGLTRVASVAGSAAAIYGTAFAVLAAGSYIALKAASNFDSQMMLLYTHANLGKDQITDFGNGLLAMAGEVGQTATALATAAYYVTSAGYNMASASIPAGSLTAALTLQRDAAMTAGMAHSDLTLTTRALVLVLNTYGGSAKTAAQLTANMATDSGLLNRIVGSGLMTMNDMVGILGNGLLPIAKELGVSFPQTGAALDALTLSGFKASNAATALRNSMLYMATGAKTGAKALESIGISHAQLVADMRSPGGLIAALDDVHNHLQGLSQDKQIEIVSQIFGRQRSTGAALALINSLSKMKDLLVEINGAADGGAAKNFAQDWAAYMTTTAYKTQSVAASINALTIMFGQALEPAFQQVLSIIGPYLAQGAVWISQNKDLFAHIVVVALAVTGLGAALTGTIAVLSMVAAVIFSGPGVAFLALTGIIYLVVTHFDQLKQTAVGVAQWFMTTLHPIFEEFGKIVQRVADWIKTKFIPKWDELVAAGKRFVDWAQGNLIHFFQDIANFIQVHVLPRLMDFANWFTSAIMPAIGIMVDAFRTSVIPAVENVVKAFMAFSGWMLDHVIPVFEWIIFNVGGVVINILEFLAQHIWIVEAAVGALVARLVLIKGIEFAGWIMGIVSNMTQMVGAFAATVAASGAVDESNQKVEAGLGTAMNAWRGLPESTSLWRAVSPRLTQNMDLLTEGIDGTSRGIGNITGSIDRLTTPLQNAAKETWNWVTREDQLAAALDKVGAGTVLWKDNLTFLTQALVRFNVALGEATGLVSEIDALMATADTSDTAYMTSLQEMNAALLIQVNDLNLVREQFALIPPVILENIDQITALYVEMGTLTHASTEQRAAVQQQIYALEQETIALMNAEFGERTLAAQVAIGTGAMDLQAKAALALGSALDKTAAQAVIDGRLMAAAAATSSGGALASNVGGGIAAAGAARAAMPANVGNGLAEAAALATAEGGVVAETGLLASAGGALSGVLGAMTSGFGLAALGAVGVATNMGGVRDSIKNALFGSGNLGDFNTMLQQTNQSATDFGNNLANNVYGDVDTLSKKFGDTQGLFMDFGRFSGVAADQFKKDWANTDNVGRSIMTSLTNLGANDTLKAVSSAANTFHLSWVDALRLVASTGDQAAKKVLAAWKDSAQAQEVAAQQVAQNQMAQDAKAVLAAQQASIQQSTTYSSTMTQAQDAVAQAKDALTNASSDKERTAAQDQLKHAQNYVDFLNSTTDPALKTQAGDLQKIADKYGITVQQLMQGGDQTVITYNGITGTISQILAKMEEQNTVIQEQNAQAYIAQQTAQEVAAGWWNVVSATAQAARNAAAVAQNSQTPQSGHGMLATGGFIRGGSNYLTTVGEDEDEWVIPRSKAGPYAGLLDSMLNGGSGKAAPTGGGGSVNVAVAAPSGGGGMTASQAQGIADGINELVAIAQRQESNGNGTPSGSPGPAVGISSALFNVVSQATRDRNRGIRGGFGTH